YGEDRWLHRPSHGLLERQQSCGAQHTLKARVQPLLGSDVHPTVLCPYHVECAIIEWKLQGIADVVRHAIAKPQPCGEDLRCSHVGLRQIDYSDVTTELDRQRPRRPPQAAAAARH